MKNKLREGFTLIELSIVLIILGLLATGVMSGTALIASSKINAVITNIQNFRTGVNTFRVAYNAAPGDFAQAGAQISIGGTQVNGNGNGQIQWAVQGCAATTCTANEALDAWKQLGALNLVQGTFSGCTYNATATLCAAGSATLTYDNGTVNVLGLYVPASKISNTGYSFDYDQYTTTSDGIVLNNNIVWLGSPDSSGNALEASYAVSLGVGLSNYTGVDGSSASNIDTKLDDGIATTGAILGYSSATPTTIALKPTSPQAYANSNYYSLKFQMLS